MFYRINENGNAAIFEDEGDVAVRFDANVYPVGSQTSVRYEHAEGIILTLEDAKKCGIEPEL